MAIRQIENGISSADQVADFRELSGWADSWKVRSSPCGVGKVKRMSQPLAQSGWHHIFPPCCSMYSRLKANPKPKPSALVV